jgi:hypothetical protein
MAKDWSTFSMAYSWMVTFCTLNVDGVHVANISNTAKISHSNNHNINMVKHVTKAKRITLEKNYKSFFPKITLTCK